ncbi:MAG TPA: permease, partial [bacterium]
MLTFLLNLLSEAAGILAEASIYLLFGFFVAGLIHAYFPEDKILKYFGGRNLRSVFNASLLGIPLPLCSCSVIPTAVQLRKSGASRGSTISFLISTPETGVDSIGISFALLDPLLSIFRPIAALITALTAGIGANF